MFLKLLNATNHKINDLEGNNLSRNSDYPIVCVIYAN